MKAKCIACLTVGDGYPCPNPNCPNSGLKPKKRPENTMQLEVKLLSTNATVPTRGSNGAAGLDLYSAEDTFELNPGDHRLVATDIAVAIPQGQVGLIWPRSGWSVKHAFDTLAGVIDADYRGPLGVVVINHGHEPISIARGDRIAQLVVQPYTMLTPVRVNELTATKRGENGFGSTGK